LEKITPKKTCDFIWSSQIKASFIIGAAGGTHNALQLTIHKSKVIHAGIRNILTPVLHSVGS
jgi:hypothetical protein